VTDHDDGGAIVLYGCWEQAMDSQEGANDLSSLSHLPLDLWASSWWM